ncbi:hypothetical protein [Anabaena azotica]|uniref:hypothetical protein n=1 Tax=Anabaena azotica TaxID=197653 RepID=UPI0039A42EF3
MLYLGDWHSQKLPRNIFCDSWRSLFGKVTLMIDLRSLSGISRAIAEGLSFAYHSLVKIQLK